jgi:hypothetical protein
MEELTYEELSNYLLVIFTGEKIKTYNQNNKSISLIFKQPSNRVRVLSDIVYQNALEEAKASGLLSTEAWEKIMFDRGLFTEADQDKIAGLESKLYAQRILLGKTTKVKANQDRIKGVIDSINKELNEIKYKRFSKLTMSAETKAEEDKNLFLCSKCVCDLATDELRWPDLESLHNEKDLDFRGEMLIDFIGFCNGYRQELIRYIARSSLWRVRYMHSIKVSDPLFGIPIVDYSSDQFNLSYWSNYYQNIYEMLPEDRPSDMVIEDDEALDAHMNAYYEERTREDAARKSKHSVKGKLSAFDKEEVIVTKSNELYEDIKYDKPREAAKLKDRTDIRKKARRRS